MKAGWEGRTGLVRLALLGPAQLSVLVMLRLKLMTPHWDFFPVEAGWEEINPLERLALVLLPELSIEEAAV